MEEIEIEGIKYNVELINEKDSNDIKTYKVIIIGKNGVGKSSITLRLMNKNIKTEPTLSVDIASFNIKVNEKIIKIQIWDSCGNEDFAKQTPNLFKNTSLSIIVYAINDEESFKDVKTWFNILSNYNPDCLKYLIGNKGDLEKEREVQKEKGEKLKEEYDFNLFLETSAESGFNIKTLLKNIAVSIYQKEKKEEENMNNPQKTIKLKLEKNKKKKRKC